MARIEIGDVAIDGETSGSGQPLLFLHGGDYFAQNQPFLDRLARRFQVTTPRHPGFGASPRPAWFRTVGDIAYLYLDLLQQRGLDDVLVVGSSFGGWIALEMAVRSTARIGRLVLVDSLGVKFGGREERDIADVFALPGDEVVRRTFADPARAPDFASYSDPEITEVARDREAAALYGWKPYMHNPSLDHWLHRVTVPTLVLWGAADRIATPHYGERLAGAIPGARFAQIADAGHYPQIEQPEAVAVAIVDFAR
jgi:pimeloyl-ACP methyl ester carboxylesterase